MIELDVEQGSHEWLVARLGIPTASAFDRLLTPKTLKRSTQDKKYLDELCAEWLLGEPLDDASSIWMERGTKLESKAVGFYEMQMDVTTRKVGLCLLDDRRAGCSPDRLIGDGGGLEIKCPSAKVHTGYLLNGFDSAHILQVQGCLWVTGRQWWDLISFNPLMPPHIVRFKRDPDIINAISEAVDDFCERLDMAKKRLLESGCKPRKPKNRRTPRIRRPEGGPIQAEPVPEMVSASPSERYEGLVDFVATRRGCDMTEAAHVVTAWLSCRGVDHIRELADPSIWQSVRESGTVRYWKEPVHASQQEPEQCPHK